MPFHTERYNKTYDRIRYLISKKVVLEILLPIPSQQ